ncbi:NAD(P)-dependent oxidoreductase [Gordonia sp. VNQ95]|jgi:nucleoside-diphosphate-sugar epimerase|uniref:NAD-dependent epimerase/dehydratase family protein n=1 Tax=Gordonia sp. VNQ95 TaxID=3156619 RepID=UPI0032B50297
MKTLVTGACGLVGSAVVRELLDRGNSVTATDLDVKDNHRVVASLQVHAATTSGSLDVRWCDLTTASASSQLVATTQPEAVVHLAALIPPFCYARPQLARAVNVDATRHLVDACVASQASPRFALASSIAVYGSRNPHSQNDLLNESTPRRPNDLYGGHKCEAEDILTASALDWVILRLGGVISAGQTFDLNPDLIAFAAALPGDGRLQSVAVGDVARAFASALTTDRSREVYLVGGDPSHRLRQEELAERTAAAVGMVGGMPPARPGDPAQDAEWFATDWMDTTRAQQVLDYQRITFDESLAQARAYSGRRRPLLRVLAPLANLALRLRSPYRGWPGKYADPWGVVAARWGAPGPDTPVPDSIGPDSTSVSVTDRPE